MATSYVDYGDRLESSLEIGQKFTKFPEMTGIFSYFSAVDKWVKVVCHGEVCSKTLEGFGIALCSTWIKYCIKTWSSSLQVCSFHRVMGSILVKHARCCSLAFTSTRFCLYEDKEDGQSTDDSIKNIASLNVSRLLLKSHKVLTNRKTPWYFLSACSLQISAAFTTCQ